MKRSVAVFAGINADGSYMCGGNNIGEEYEKMFYSSAFFYASHNRFLLPFMR
jgi:hypothetical protein